jgi:hypothetical protein
MTLLLSPLEVFAQDFTWSPAENLSAGQSARQGSIIRLSTDGTLATTVYRITDASKKLQLVSRSATISAGVASWGPATTVSNTAESLKDISFDDSFDLAVSPDGTKAVAVWIAGASSTARAVTVRIAAATISGNVATWGTATALNLGAGSNPLLPRIALSADGSRALSCGLGCGCDR